MYLPFCVSLGFLLEASSGNIYERSTLNLTLLHILSDGKQNKNNNNNVSKLSIQNPMLYYILFQKNIPGNGRSLPGPHHPCKFLPAPFARRLSRGAARARIDSRREGKGREGKGRNITTKVRQATVKSSCLITVLLAYAIRQPVCSVSFDFDHSKTALKTTHKKKQDDDKGIKSNF